MTFHHFGLIVSVTFALIAVLISFFLIWRHATHYLKPWEQRQCVPTPIPTDNLSPLSDTADSHIIFSALSEYFSWSLSTPLYPSYPISSTAMRYISKSFGTVMKLLLSQVSLHYSAITQRQIYTVRKIIFGH